jgi:hypothetical protein
MWLPLFFMSVAVSAEPMRLDDLTPRWVVVQFEDSPSDRPDLLDGVYTRPYAAWLEPDERGRVTIRVSGDVLEKNLFRDNDPLPGSFSDFLWIFDPVSGDVLSAEFSGVFLFTIDWGIAKSNVEAKVEARMGTTRPGGFRPARRVLGRALIGYCEDVGSRRCQAVPPRAYDAGRGYVNAVGYLSIDSPLTRFNTYSAVGEARFSEIHGDVRFKARESEAEPPADRER